MSVRAKTELRRVRREYRRRVGPCVHQHPHHIRVALEDRAGQRRLAAVIGRVGVASVVKDQPDRAGMAVIGGQHQE